MGNLLRRYVGKIVSNFLLRCLLVSDKWLYFCHSKIKRTTVSVVCATVVATEELKGNLVKVKDYPRSCEFCLLEYQAVCGGDNATGFRGWEGDTAIRNESEDLPLWSRNHSGFRVEKR